MISWKYRWVSTKRCIYMKFVVEVVKYLTTHHRIFVYPVSDCCLSTTPLFQPANRTD
jgi:hypothetical protein